MSRFQSYINEARKNPEQNPKIGIVQALEPYKNDSNMFIQFSDINKLGVNPKTEFNTPAGIYAYPLKQIWKDLVNNKIPFAGERKYVILFQAVNYITNRYNSLDSDIQKLYKFYRLIDNQVRLGKMNATNQTPLGQLWNITRMIASRETGDSVSNSIWKWNSIFRKLGYNGVADLKGEGIIHENEPTQAVFFSTQGLNVINVIENNRYTNNIDYKGVFEPFLKYIEQKEKWNSKNILETIDYIYKYRYKFNGINYDALSKYYQGKIYKVLLYPEQFADEYSDALTTKILEKINKYYYTLNKTNNISYTSSLIHRLKVIFFKILKSKATNIFKDYIDKHFDKYREIIKKEVSEGSSIRFILATLEYQIQNDAQELFDRLDVKLDKEYLSQYIISLYAKEREKGNV